MWECSSTVVFLESLRDGLTLISRQNGLTLASRSLIRMECRGIILHIDAHSF